MLLILNLHFYMDTVGNFFVILSALHTHTNTKIHRDTFILVVDEW